MLELPNFGLMTTHRAYLQDRKFLSKCLHFLKQQKFADFGLKNADVS